MIRARITPLGDSAITMIFGNEIDESINQQVFSAFDYLQKQNLDFIQDIIPAYASLSVVYDIAKIRRKGETNAYDYMHDLMKIVLQQSTSIVSAEKRMINIPVCYHELFGTDLIVMSRQKELSVEEIIQLHSSVTYRVYMLGFLPGFAYMGKVNGEIATPRKAVPDKNVLGGSIGIADAQDRHANQSPHHPGGGLPRDCPHLRAAIVLRDARPG